MVISENIIPHMEYKMIDLNAMTVFAKVAECGGFSRAGERLAMPVSTVSRKVVELEKALGVRLLERSTRSVRLTEIGESYFRQCQRGLQELEAANLSIEDRQQEVSGVLRLSVPPSISEGLFVPIIAAFQRSYPKARVHVFVTERTVDLIADGVDLTIRIGELADSALSARRILTYRHILLASPDYLKRHGMPLSPDELAGHRLLAFGALGRPVDWTFARAAEIVTVRVEPHFQINDYLAIQKAAIEGQGIGDMPAILCGPALRHGSLTPVMADWRSPSVDLSAIHVATRNMSRLVRLFLDHCAASMRRQVDQEAVDD